MFESLTDSIAGSIALAFGAFFAMMFLIGAAFRLFTQALQFTLMGALAAIGILIKSVFLGIARLFSFGISRAGRFDGASGRSGSQPSDPAAGTDVREAARVEPYRLLNFTLGRR